MSGSRLKRGPQCTRLRAQGRGRVFRTDLCSIRPSTVCLEGDGGPQGCRGALPPDSLRREEEVEALGVVFSSCGPTSTFQEGAGLKGGTGRVTVRPGRALGQGPPGPAVHQPALLVGSDCGAAGRPSAHKGALSWRGSVSQAQSCCVLGLGLTAGPQAHGAWVLNFCILGPRAS